LLGKRPFFSASRDGILRTHVSSPCSLTAWPLIRDVFFYSVSLIVLVAFFLDNKIYWYEALILFLWYGAYVSFMKFNEVAEDKLRKLFGMKEVVSRGGGDARRWRDRIRVRWYLMTKRPGSHSSREVRDSV